MKNPINLKGVNSRCFTPFFKKNWIFEKGVNFSKIQLILHKQFFCETYQSNIIAMIT